MSAGEVAARVRDAARIQAHQAGFLPAKRPPEARTRPAPRWVRPLETPDPEPYVTAAENIMRGTVAVFSSAAAIGDVDFEWNRDPLTGVLAPMRFGPTLDLHSREVVGDIKYLWELNRHLELVGLAQAYEVTGDDRYIRSFRRLLSSWFRQCPYSRGPNWASGLELAIRLVNWGVAWQMAGGLDASIFEGEAGSRFRSDWLDSVYQHVHFIRSHYSRFSSANNHLVGEAAGVYVACCTWPFWGEFADWRDDAYAILTAEAEAQVSADGVGLEQSVAYQRFVLDFFTLCMMVGRANGIEFPAEYQERVSSMLKFLASIMNAGGILPMIGDSDDGCVLRLSQEPGFCPFRSALATGAMLFGMPELAGRAGRLDDQTRSLMGEEGWHQLVKSVPSDPASGLKTAFPDGGYYVLGSDLGTDREVRLLVDAGPLGYLSIAAHGHADALAVCLSVAGREMLVDPGTYTYHGGVHWRAHFRGTRAHNTITVDGQDQSVQGGSFMWLRHAMARCLKFEKSDEMDYFVGEHNGYRRLADPVVHRREIRSTGGLIEITDTLTCTGRHSVEQWWHFSEECNVRVVDDVLLVDNRSVHVRLVPDAGADAVRLFHGCDDPIAGWISRRYDTKVPAPAVRVTRSIRGTTSLRTTIKCRPD